MCGLDVLLGLSAGHTSSRGCALGLIDGYRELLAWYELCAAGLLSVSPIVLSQFYNSVTYRAVHGCA